VRAYRKQRPPIDRARLSRTVADGKTVEHEFLLLRMGPRGVEYVATPSGQAETVFTATRVGPAEVVFENPAHDFPTRITYRKTDGGLAATMTEQSKGSRARLTFAIWPPPRARTDAAVQNGQGRQFQTRVLNLTPWRL